MNHMRELTPAESGDIIRHRGHDYVIDRILDQWDECSMGTAFYCIECYTTDGQYRIWKQYYDGGKLVKVDDKTLVTEKLAELLKCTRAFSDLDYCKYEKADNGNEYVHVVGKPNEEGYRWKYKCNVTWDSGIALIRDVLKQIG